MTGRDRPPNYALNPPRSAVTALAQGGTHRALWAALGGKG